MEHILRDAVTPTSQYPSQERIDCRFHIGFGEGLRRSLKEDQRERSQSSEKVLGVETQNWTQSFDTRYEITLSSCLGKSSLL